MTLRKTGIITLVALALTLVLSACGEPEEPSASQSLPSPDGRILTANQAANTITILDVATDRTFGSVATGQQPHHVAATPDGKEFWVTLYGENRLQVFDSATLKEIASVDVGAVNDDLMFDPQGKRLYVSLGNNNSVAVVDVAARKLLQTVPVGKTPHGLRVTPDGSKLLVTNTADNTLSVLSLEPEAKVEASIKTGANPFEVIVNDAGDTAYVSNFLGDSIAVVDLKTNKTTGYIRSGKQPAMLSIHDNAGTTQLWVANTGSGEVWLIDPVARKLITRLPTGRGAHGTAITQSGKLYVTNTNDNSVTVIDLATEKVLSTVPVGNGPNGIVYLPPAQ
jgi:YVTN family beta-propeller protein